MSSLWTDMLFLHGHIADAKLARRLAQPTPPAPPARPKGASSSTRRGVTFYLAASLRRSLWMG